MNSEKEIKKSNLKVRIYVLVIISILLIMLTSFGFFFATRSQSDRNYLAGGCFNQTFTDGDSINIENALPQTNKEGLSNDPYHFTLTNTCSKKIRYHVILNVKNNSLADKNVMVSLNGGYAQKLNTLPVNTLENTIDSGYTNSYLLKTGTLAQASVTENIRAFISDEADYSEIQSSGKTSFTAKIKVVAEVLPEYKLATTTIQNIVSGSPTNSTDVITKTAPAGSTCTNTLAYDGTSDNNLRYVGANPCNYVSFNDEAFTAATGYYNLRSGNYYTHSFSSMAECQSIVPGWGNSNDNCVEVARTTLTGWRIVGVMNNIDDGTGKLETRIKLIRAAEIGNYSIDDQYNPSTSGQKYKGINDWGVTELMKELNSDYINPNLTNNTYWHQNSTNMYYYYTRGIKAGALKFIGDAKWNTGGTPATGVKVAEHYVNERGTTAWGTNGTDQCIDDVACPRSTSWTGKIALPYPSDYGFAVGGSVRSTCLTSTNLNAYNSNSCQDNDWIYSTTIDRLWFLTPASTSSDSFRSIMGGSYQGLVGAYTANAMNSVVPSLYLNADVAITGGSGTPDDPYTLST